MGHHQQHRAPPTPADPQSPGDLGPTTKTFSLKMASWLTDLGPDGSAQAPLEIDTAPAAPSPAAAPPPDLASPFASRPSHLFAAPPVAAAPVQAPAPASVREGGSAPASSPGVRAPTA